MNILENWELLDTIISKQYFSIHKAKCVFKNAIEYSTIFESIIDFNSPEKLEKTLILSNDIESKLDLIKSKLNLYISLINTSNFEDNISKILDFQIKKIDDNYVLYIITEELFRREKISTEIEYLNLALSISKSISFFHSKNIVHKLITEENIFKSKLNNYIFFDFNYNISMSNYNDDYLYYLAPEIIKNESYNSNSDIYSFGILLYKLINNGNFPFISENENNIKLSNELRLSGYDIPPLKNISQDFSNIIIKACHYSNTLRYQNISELISDLENFKLKEYPNINFDTTFGKPENLIISDNLIQPKLQDNKNIENTKDFYNNKPMFMPLISIILILLIITLFFVNHNYIREIFFDDTNSVSIKTQHSQYLLSSNILVYSKENFTGDSISLKVGEYSSLDYYGIDFSIKSILVGEYLKIEIYDKSDFQGNKIELNDKISSIPFNIKSLKIYST